MLGENAAYIFIYICLSPEANKERTLTICRFINNQGRAHLFRTQTSEYPCQSPTPCKEHSTCSS